MTMRSALVVVALLATGCAPTASPTASCEEDMPCWIGSPADSRSYDDRRADALANGWKTDAECVTYRWNGSTIRRCPTDLRQEH